MQNGLHAMKSALRVLTAFAGKHHPDPVDGEAPRRFALRQPSGPVDELGCEVIDMAICVRAKARSAGATGAKLRV